MLYMVISTDFSIQFFFNVSFGWAFYCRWCWYHPSICRENANNMNMAEKYSAIYRGAWKQGFISPQKTHTTPKIKGKKKKQRQRNKERKPKLNIMVIQKVILEPSKESDSLQVYCIIVGSDARPLGLGESIPHCSICKLFFTKQWKPNSPVLWHTVKNKSKNSPVTEILHCLVNHLTNLV